MADVSKHLSRQALDRARDGDTESVKTLASYASSALRGEIELNDSIREWLLGGLQTIVDGGDVANGFLLKKRRGGNKYKNVERDINIAQRVRELNQDMTLPECYAVAADEFCISENQVRKIYEYWRPGLVENERLQRE